MPAKKKGDKKGGGKKKKGAGDGGMNAALSKKFLKHYQSKCETSGCLPYLSLVQDITACIENDKLIENFVLEIRAVPPPAVPAASSSSDDSVKSDKDVRLTVTERLGVGVSPLVEEPRLTLQPLLDSMRDTRCKTMTHFAFRGLPLANSDAATLTIFLGTEYVQALRTLELIRADISEWAFPPLLKSLSTCKLLTTLALDHNLVTPPTLSALQEGLLDHPTLTNLSLDFCQLGPESGTGLGRIVVGSSVQSLSLLGNSLGCEGCVGLLAPVVEACERSAKIPSLSRLYLMDNRIDQHGPAGLAGPVNCCRTVKQLLVADPLLVEVNLDTNLIGESAALEVLDGLRQRKEASLQSLRITVTHRITHETFKAIIDLSVSFGKKKKKKGGKKKKKA